MNEHSFTRAVVRILPTEVHVQSMTTASLSTKGTPDRYFDYHKDLWVEFKYAQNIPKHGLDVGHSDKSLLTALQKRWLLRRYNAGKNACVIVGVPSDRHRGFILDSPKAWLNVVPQTYIRDHILNAPELAHYILGRIT